MMHLVIALRLYIAQCVTAISLDEFGAADKLFTQLAARQKKSYSAQ